MLEMIRLGRVSLVWTGSEAVAVASSSFPAVSFFSRILHSISLSAVYAESIIPGNKPLQGSRGGIRIRRGQSLVVDV